MDDETAARLWRILMRDEKFNIELHTRIAKVTVCKWMEVEDPTEPFGFAYKMGRFNCQVEVHVVNGHLEAYKVTHTGQLMELVRVKV